MKITDKVNLTGTQKRNLSFGSLVMLIFSGILISSLMMYIKDDFSFIINGNLSIANLIFFKVPESGLVFKYSLKLFAVLAISVFIQYISGFFAFGQPFTIANVFLQGVTLGTTASMYYLYFGGKGFFYILFLLLPFALPGTWVLVLGARESVKSSNMFLRYIFSKSDNEKRPDIKLYTIKFSVLILLAVGASALTFVFSYVFLKVI